MSCDIEGFEAKRVKLDDGDLYVRRGGHGPTLVLLHGMRQHGLMWHTVAPLLATDFTVNKLTDYRTHVVPGAGHWLGDENPQDVADALAKHFSGDAEQ